ncbi:hypothetical protein [Streptomyces hydrogenans]|uniref:hypothetical protein n=1 Tax=Streptomyces hydrogenans TaxID=1873719 RepID=UPI00381C1279
MAEAPGPGSSSPDSPSPDSASPETGNLEAARALVDAFPALSLELRHVPRAMRAELTALTARWLAAGHPPAAVRAHILRCLPDDGTPVRRPGGFLRHLLGDVPPLALTVPTVPAVADRDPGPRLSPRLSGARECAGDHIQPTLFRPAGDETHCPRCTAHAAPPATAPAQFATLGTPPLRPTPNAIR